ncbi:AraC family transcriptional regulator [Solirubrobacter sp. CPCC 204708]|uniref:AraC family transcriptional regulator n=1 Tax=Solirubrobacter deserti TaxID=2282478 RepID=A0ABT4RCJ4_9ACTN|nr:AraC family transcriptional regulator [Solirubrobacter deserti]MBE2315591.1 AraC family transcriptional regulator [Solirubrobacter deserti]MDA0136231.1 AraC family transcriptional regulator [Solirubrobacter deserti]
MDLVTDMLERARARGACFSHSVIRGPFGLAFDAVAGLAVHAVVEGELFLWTDDRTRCERLISGDIALVRGGLDHCLATSPDAALTPLDDFLADTRVSERRYASGTEGDPAEFFCGAYMFEGDLCDELLRRLPDTIRLRPAAGSALRTTLDLLAREMDTDEPGQQTLLDRLLDVALVQALREHFTAMREDAPAWYRASADPQLGPALRAVHARPDHPWTVESLAAEATLSRAAFARRFSAALGVAPLTYVTSWRMALAREQLRDSEDQIAAVASALGYASEFSFAAAFKRHHGLAPGKWRAQAHLASATS